MTGLYWHASHARPFALSFVMGVSLLALAASEFGHTQKRQPHQQEKLAAATLAERAFDALRAERMRRGIGVDSHTDPTQSGLIGSLLTPITTDAGKLAAKQTSVNVNFAAVVVDMLYEAGVHNGDTIAVSMTGSFPAFDIATLAAASTLNLRTLITVSAAASQWGANEPNFSWLDMFNHLQARGIFSVKPVAASRGGIGDVARGMSEEGQTLLDQAIERLGVPKLSPRSWDEGVEQRLGLFRQNARGKRIAAFVNVGGGIFSTGAVAGKHSFAPGLNRTQPEGMPMVNSLMQHFLNEGVPVINLLQAEQLALRYGLPHVPEARVAVGEGGVFSRPAYNRGVAGLGIFAIVLAMAATFRRRA